jgi:hypothetical protein
MRVFGSWKQFFNSCLKEILFRPWRLYDMNVLKDEVGVNKNVTKYVNWLSVICEQIRAE